MPDEPIMQASGFVQTPCPKCGSQVWVSPPNAGYCPQCQTQVSAPMGAAPAASPYGAPAAGNAAAFGATMLASPGSYGAPAAGPAPGAYGAPAGMPAQSPMGAPPGMPGAQPPMGAAPNPYAAANPPANPYASFPGARGAGGVQKGAAIGGAVLLVLGGLAFAGVKSYLIKSKGMASAKDVGIDPKKADVVQMIEGTKPLARKWRSDAEFYSINVNGWKGDGTVDLTDGGTVTVTWYSPSRVKSSSAKGREDSIKKFVFNGSDVNYKSLWKATNPWKGVEATPVPKCTAKKLAAQLKDDDVDLAKDAILAIDPTWGQAWHVISGSKVNRWFDLGDCSELKLKVGGGDDSAGAGAGGDE